MSDNFVVVIKRHKMIALPISISLFTASSTLGAQRTGLSIFSQSLSGLFSQYLIVGAALSLGIFGGSKAVGNFVGGRLSVSKGRDRTSQAGVVLVLIGSLFLSIAPNLLIFMMGNSVVGAGIGILFASSTISLTDIATADHRGKAISMMELSVYFGTAFGSIVSGQIAHSLGYRMIFHGALVLSSLTFLISFFLKDTREFNIQEEKPIYFTARQKLKQLQHDWKESDEQLNENKIFDTLFPLVKDAEKGREYEDFSTSAFFQPSFILTFTSGMVSRIADTAIIIILPLLILNYNYSATQLGLITSLFTICWGIGIAFSGAFSDKMGRKLPMVFGLIMESFGYVMLYLIGLNDWLPNIIVGISVAGIGRGIYFPIPSSASTDLVPPRLRAYTLGLYRFLLDFGYVIGAILMILIIEPRSSIISKTELYEPVMIVIIFLLLLQAMLLILFFKDPRPGFIQISEMKSHLDYSKESIYYLTRSIEYYSNNDKIRSREELEKGKLKEKEADRVLESMTHATYARAWKATDALELLQFSTKVDKAIGYVLRGVRKLLLIEDDFNQSFKMKLIQYARLFDILIDTTQETFELISIRIHLAVQQSYQVNYVEEFLDEIHRQLWADLMVVADDLKPLSLMLMSNAIESLEKAANILEDAAEVIRLISFKH